jgi:hypothetical protein
MSSSQSEIIGKYSAETFYRSIDAQPQRHIVTTSASPDVIAMVNHWLETQSSPQLNKSHMRSSSSKKSRDSSSSTSSNFNTKKVHWASKLEDYDDQHHRKPVKCKTSSRDKETKPILSKKRQMKCPPVPEPPRSRGPPPAPRPRRLPTPEIAELEHGDFCECCSKSVRKMNAQSKLCACFSLVKHN